MKLSSSIYRPGGIGRFAMITRILIRHGLGDIVDRMFSKTGKGGETSEGITLNLRTGYPSPRRIRRILEELGPSFIKLGQLMSTRADVFPPEYITELKKLQDRVPPVPFPEIRQVIQRELGQPVDEVFSTFEAESIAAASVAQVHTARLTTGETVAVKVIRPDCKKTVRKDIRLMYYFAEKIERHFDIGRIIGAVNMVKEFERTIYKELDMYIEAGTMEKFAANFADSDEIYIPKVHWDYTTRSVLVMEHIEGIKMDRVESLKARGIDPREVALIGLRSFSRQLMEFGLFHADPHPANTIVLYDGRVSLVDFGIIGYLDEETMRQIANLFLGYAEHDYDMVMAALLDAGMIDEDTMDLKSFRMDLTDISEQFYGRSLKRISVRDVYDQVMRLVLNYRIQMPRDLLLLFKTFIQTEALGKILDSDASLLEVTRPYAAKLLQRGYEARKVFRSMESNARTLGGYMKLMPKMVHDILRQIAGGQHRIELRHTGFEGMDSRLEKGLNRLIIGIIISASTIAGALILNSSQMVLEIEIPFLGAQALSVTGLLGLTAYTIATVLGLWLIFSIFRSGKM